MTKSKFLILSCCALILGCTSSHVSSPIPVGMFTFSAAGASHHVRFELYTNTTGQRLAIASADVVPLSDLTLAAVVWVEKGTTLKVAFRDPSEYLRHIDVIGPRIEITYGIGADGAVQLGAQNCGDPTSPCAYSWEGINESRQVN